MGGMTCADTMQIGLRRCVPHQRLGDALEIMGEENVDWVAVVESHDNPSFLGWITAQRAAVFLAVFDRRPSETMCRELIASPPAVLAPGDEAVAARATLAQHHVCRLPVVDQGLLVGAFGSE